jgi:hypothetical protein
MNQRIIELLKNSGVLKEGEVTRKHKKHFFGVTADFERESKRVLAFYERNLVEHPELKQSLKRLKRLLNNIEEVFTQTEVYLDDKNFEEPKLEIGSTPDELEIEEEI